MKILQASISENGTTGWDGKAKKGDQGNELNIKPWYDKPWDAVLRHPSRDIALRAAVTAYKLYYSRLVGYDQSERNTLYQGLKSCGFDVDAYIDSGIKAETDCSALVYAAYAVHMPTIRSDGNAPVTAEMVDFYSDHGFTVFKSPAYTRGTENLLVGDILVKAGKHTCICVGNMPETKRGTTVLDYIRSVMGESKRLEDARKIGIYRAKTELNLRATPVTGDSVAVVPTGGMIACYGEYMSVDGHTWLHGSYFTTGRYYDGWFRRSYTDKVT